MLREMHRSIYVPAHMRFKGVYWSVLELAKSVQKLILVPWQAQVIVTVSLLSRPLLRVVRVLSFLASRA